MIQKDSKDTHCVMKRIQVLGQEQVRGIPEMENSYHPLVIREGKGRTENKGKERERGREEEGGRREGREKRKEDRKIDLEGIWLSCVSLKASLWGT